MTNDPTISINKSQQRRIATTLAQLDETLCRFDRWLHTPSAESVLYHEHDTLTGNQRAAIETEIKDLRKTLTELRDDLHLEPTRQDIADAIRSHCSVYWVTLAELETKRLRGYGEIPQGFADYFDTRIEELLVRLRRIASATRQEDANCPESTPSRRAPTAR